MTPGPGGSDRPAKAGVTGDAPSAGDPGEEPQPDPIPADERALLDAFDRLSPQGSLRWGFDDAMRRIAQPETDVAVEPWSGLPADLWQRGRSARIGQRFVGDVAGVLAELLASDARTAAAQTSAAGNMATWDALRYLAARVDALERASDPVGLEAAELPIPPPDLVGVAGLVDGLLGPAEPTRTVLVGECGDGALLPLLEASGWRAEGVEPRAGLAWAGLAGSGASAPTIQVAEVLDYLRSVPPDGRAGVVLTGCVDRLGLVDKVGLLTEAERVTRPGGTVVVLTTDQSAWDAALDPPARDLAPGRPLHPETWSLLLRRAGLAEVVWQRPESGMLHAVGGRVGRAAGSPFGPRVRQ